MDGGGRGFSRKPLKSHQTAFLFFYFSFLVVVVLERVSAALQPSRPPPTTASTSHFLAAAANFSLISKVSLLPPPLPARVEPTQFQNYIHRVPRTRIATKAIHHHHECKITLTVNLLVHKLLDLFSS